MFQKLIMKMLPVIISQATPEIKNAIQAIINDLKKKAAATPNPFDDMLVSVIEAFFCE